MKNFSYIKYGKMAGIGGGINRHLEVLNEKGCCWLEKIETTHSILCIKKRGI